MSSAPPSVPVFRLVSEPSGPRFLGLTVAERNVRVARRAAQGAVTHDDDARAPILIVPAGVAITRTLIEALPLPIGTWRLMWDGPSRPIVWHGTQPIAHGLSTVDARLSTVQLPDGAAFDVSTRATRRRAAWRLLRASGKPTDGWLARHVHRRISRVFSYVLLQLGVSANAATVLTFFVGACSAWLVAQTSHATIIGGALLFWCASIADGIDGEMARLTLSESKWGEQLDTAVDHATHFLCYAALMVGWWRQGMGPIGAALAVGVAAGIPLALLWGMRLVRDGRPAGGHGHRDAHFFVDTKPIELAVADAGRATGAPALRLASWIFVFFRREAFSLTFFLVSLTTAERAVYPALLAIGLAIVTLTLVAYRDPIERALDR